MPRRFAVLAPFALIACLIAVAPFVSALAEDARATGGSENIATAEDDGAFGPEDAPDTANNPEDDATMGVVPGYGVEASRDDSTARTETTVPIPAINEPIDDQAASEAESHPNTDDNASAPQDAASTDDPVVHDDDPAQDAGNLEIRTGAVSESGVETSAHPPTMPDALSFLGEEVVDVGLLTAPIRHLPISAVGDAGRQAQVRQAVAEAVQWIPSSLTTAQKVHVAFDYIAATCSYDWGFDWPDAYDAWGALVKRSSACQGYSQAFKLVMDELGIPCYIVYGVAWNGHSNVGHAWNLVQVDGSWYHVDVTWADLFGSIPAQSGLDRLYSCDGSHGYLLLSDSAISRDRFWADGDMPQSCPSSYTFAQNSATTDAIELPFSDTPPTAWYITGGYIQYVKDAGLMTGYGSTTHFGPEDPVTRGQVATVLYRYANPDSAATSDPSQYGRTTHFSDVKKGVYYTAAIEWCYQHGIVEGYAGTGTFGPEDLITREQLATMLYRFAKSTGADPRGGSIEGFPDRASISAYAKEAMGWCRDAGILTGDGATGKAMPQSNATRAQMAKMITVAVRDVL